MIGHRAKIRQHLRSARAAALTPEERQAEMRAAMARSEEQLSATADAVSGNVADAGVTMEAVAAADHEAHPAAADTPVH